MILRPRLRFLPGGREGGGILPSVIAVMVYLCVMAVAVGLSAHNAASGWSSELNGTATLQVVHTDRAERTRQAGLALEMLGATPGIEKAEMLSDDAIAELLEPWLGSGNVTDDLPVPALIAITLAPGARIDLSALYTQLQEVAPDSRLDDQQIWIEELSYLARAVQMAALAAVLMIAGATVAIVIFATRARLASHASDVEIVHTMGAEDKMVADELRYRFLIYGLQGSATGFVAAIATLFTVHYFSQQVGGGMVPQLVLAPAQFAILLSVPLVGAAIATLTAGTTTMRALAKML